MSRLRRAWYWVAHITPLRLLAAGMVLAGALIGITGWVVLNSANVASDALHARDRTASAASARITQLQGRITQLQAEGEETAGKVAELSAELAAVQEQVRRMGGNPIVPITTTTTTTTRSASASPAPSQPPAAPTTTTTAPRGTTTTTAPTTTTTVCRLVVNGRCVV